MDGGATRLRWAFIRQIGRHPSQVDIDRRRLRCEVAAVGCRERTNGYPAVIVCKLPMMRPGGDRRRGVQALSRFAQRIRRTASRVGECVTLPAARRPAMRRSVFSHVPTPISGSSFQPPNREFAACSDVMRHRLALFERAPAPDEERRRTVAFVRALTWPRASHVTYARSVGDRRQGQRQR